MASTTVTSTPRATASVATSAPIQPAPTSTNRVPGRSDDRSRRASSAVRSVSAVESPGSRRGAAPVASTIASASMTPSSVVTRPASTDSARVDSRRSTSSAAQSASSVVSSVWPRSSSFVSGGRSYGSIPSPPRRVSGPR